MKKELFKPTTDAELKKYHDREEVLVARGIREVAEWIDAWWERGKGGKQNWYELEAKLKEWGIK